jgi:type III secretory pathway component EscV
VPDINNSDFLIDGNFSLSLLKGKTFYTTIQSDYEAYYSVITIPEDMENMYSQNIRYGSYTTYKLLEDNTWQKIYESIAKEEANVILNYNDTYLSIKSIDNSKEIRETLIETTNDYYIINQETVNLIGDNKINSNKKIKYYFEEPDIITNPESINLKEENNESTWN